MRAARQARARAMRAAGGPGARAGGATQMPGRSKRHRVHAPEGVDRVLSGESYAFGAPKCRFRPTTQRQRATGHDKSLARRSCKGHETHGPSPRTPCSITTYPLDHLPIDAVVDARRKVEAQTDEMLQAPLLYRRMSPEERHEYIIEMLRGIGLGERLGRAAAAQCPSSQQARPPRKTSHGQPLGRRRAGRAGVEPGVVRR